MNMGKQNDEDLISSVVDVDKSLDSIAEALKSVSVPMFKCSEALTTLANMDDGKFEDNLGKRVEQLRKRGVSCSTLNDLIFEVYRDGNLDGDSPMITKYRKGRVEDVEKVCDGLLINLIMDNVKKEEERDMEQENDEQYNLQVKVRDNLFEIDKEINIEIMGETPRYDEGDSVWFVMLDSGAWKTVGAIVEYHTMTKDGRQYAVWGEDGEEYLALETELWRSKEESGLKLRTCKDLEGAYRCLGNEGQIVPQEYNQMFQVVYKEYMDHMKQKNVTTIGRKYNDGDKVWIITPRDTQECFSVVRAVDPLMSGEYVVRDVKGDLFYALETEMFSKKVSDVWWNAIHEEIVKRLEDMQEVKVPTEENESGIHDPVVTEVWKDWSNYILQKNRANAGRERRFAIGSRVWGLFNTGIVGGVGVAEVQVLSYGGNIFGQSGKICRIKDASGFDVDMYEEGLFNSKERAEVELGIVLKEIDNRRCLSTRHEDKESVCQCDRVCVSPKVPKQDVNVGAETSEGTNVGVEIKEEIPVEVLEVGQAWWTTHLSTLRRGVITRFLSSSLVELDSLGKTGKITVPKTTLFKTRKLAREELKSSKNGKPVSERKIEIKGKICPKSEFKTEIKGTEQSWINVRGVAEPVKVLETYNNGGMKVLVNGGTVVHIAKNELFKTKKEAQSDLRLPVKGKKKVNKPSTKK